MAKTLVVIPAYNEAENILRLLPMVVAQAPNTDVLVVDDHSPDGTATLVKDLMAADPRIHLIERAAKMGLGTAYVAGFRYAIANAFDYVVCMDADFSHDPAEIPNFLEKIQGCDLVIGSRYVDGVRILNWPMSRLLLSYSGNLYSRFVTGLPVCDATSGFKCYRRAVLEGIDLDGMKSNGYAFQIEMVYKAWRKGFKLAEVPITFLERRSGASKMSRQIVYEAVFMVWKLRLRSLFNRL
ncbi:MAG: polyprenol monophosphomannose synthase [Vicinamibacterales bacterium]